MSDLRVNITGNQSGFQATLQQATQSAKNFSNNLNREVGKSWVDAFSFKNLARGAAGFFGFEAIKNSLESLIQKGSELRQIAEQFDISTDSVQRWEKATGKAGVTFGLF